MMCAWKQLLSVLPPEISEQAASVGKEALQELRLRVNAPPELITSGGSVWPTERVVEKADLDFVMNAASRYSPWCAGTMARGYLTAPGGHRIGICGEGFEAEEGACGFRSIRSLCIRVAKDFPGLAQKAAGAEGSILIVGAPGWGKTTLLRDLARQISRKQTVCVVDERGELFPEGLERGKRMDVLTGIGKARGMDMVLRTMSPMCIAVDEITAQSDCIGLLQAANCGVRLIATAHAGSGEDMKSRALYRTLLENNVFQTRLQLHADKSYRVERMAL